MWALVLTFCSGIAGTPKETCNDYIVDTATSLADCREQMSHQRESINLVSASCMRRVELGKDYHG